MKTVARHVPAIAVSALAILLLAALPAGAYNFSSAELILPGADYSASSGRWFTSPDSAAYTYWRGWVEYEFELTAGEWTFGLEVINRGYLGADWYSRFRVQDSITGQVMEIPASDDTAYVGTQTARIFSDGLYTVRFSWLNDKWGPNFRPVRDANIQINTVFFDKVASTPEPASGLLLASAMGLTAWLRRQKKFALTDCGAYVFK
jgi:hypothetical protein